MDPLEPVGVCGLEVCTGPLFLAGLSLYGPCLARCHSGKIKPGLAWPMLSWARPCLASWQAIVAMIVACLLQWFCSTLQFANHNAATSHV